MNRAVITGLGIYSCLGTTLDAVEQSLREGRSGITLDPQRKDLGFRSALTARLDVPNLKGELSRSQRTYMPEQAKYAYVATRDALRQAGLDADYIDRHDVGILYGNDSTAEAVVHSMDLLREKRDTTLIGSGSIFQSMNSTVTMNLSCIFRLRGINLTISTLTGDMTPTQKNHALLAIISGDANIIIGTHALIQDTVEFFDLGLVIIDEQHRFGVEQRDSLRTKGKNHTTPHLLVMTATPIPRTIAMTFFGDLNHSTLSELPGGRRPIKSYVVPEYLPKYTTRAYEVMREHIHQGHQIYIVCPRINGPGGVLETHQHLSETEFKNYRIGLLHGQLKDADKDTIMRQFANGDLDILIATTVIEVGIDVPNATIIMIRESENLGVSQLHQLRGRVGRGGYDSICFFHHTAERGTPADKRIWQMAATTDGFQVADIDLIQRHEGDVLGTSQSGTNKKIAFLNLARDIGLINRANRDAKNIVAHNLDLARQLIAGIDDITQDYLDKS